MLDSTWGQGLNIGHPQLIIFKLCSPKNDHFISFYGVDPHFQTQPLGTLIYLAWHFEMPWTVSDTRDQRGRNTTRQRRNWAESLDDLGLIQKGFTDFT
jgi:hypothetical protein